MEEHLFKTQSWYVYMRPASDGRVDYTIYNKNFDAIDSGGALTELDPVDFAKLVSGESVIKELLIEEYEELI